MIAADTDSSTKEEKERTSDCGCHFDPRYSSQYRLVILSTKLAAKSHGACLFQARSLRCFDYAFFVPSAAITASANSVVLAVPPTSRVTCLRSRYTRSM